MTVRSDTKNELVGGATGGGPGFDCRDGGTLRGWRTCVVKRCIRTDATRPSLWIQNVSVFESGSG